MGALRLVSEAKTGNNSLVKLILSVLAVCFLGFSCTPIDPHTAGGGAFDDSAVGQALDSNGPLPGDRTIGGAESFEQWRNERE